MDKGNTTTVLLVIMIVLMVGFGTWAFLHRASSVPTDSNAEITVPISGDQSEGSDPRY